MSVLVRGMDMPANSKDCPFTVMDDWEMHCIVGGKYEWHKDRLCDGCPLLHIPPHGRLIDADAFSEKILEIVVRQKYDESYTETLSIGAILREVVNELRGMGLDGFNNAPTIIPADESE